MSRRMRRLSPVFRSISSPVFVVVPPVRMTWPGERPEADLVCSSYCDPVRTSTDPSIRGSVWSSRRYTIIPLLS